MLSQIIADKSEQSSAVGRLPSNYLYPMQHVRPKSTVNQILRIQPTSGFKISSFESQYFGKTNRSNLQKAQKVSPTI